MALSAPKSHLLLFFFFLVFLIHAKTDLHPSDLKAFSTFQKDLGVVNSQFHPCNTDGIFCERRLSNNDSYILRITRLIFKNKKLNGVLFPSIGRLSELKELSLSNNQLVNQIPSQIVLCRKLEILDLGNNRLSGQVPLVLSSLMRIRVLDISSNKLSGNLNFLKYLPNLERLSVANNFFAGRIPVSLHSFRNLQHFNFSGNQFLEVPGPTKRFGRSASDVPKRYMLAENSKASNRISAPAPKFNNKINSTAEAPHKSSRRKVEGWILGSITGAVVVTIFGFLYSLLLEQAIAVMKRGGKSSGSTIFSPLIKAEDLAFLEEEDRLNSLEFIGRGGCGEVYKAELPGSNGKIIAIKKIIQPPKDATELADEDSKLLHKKMRQIRSEIITVGRIRHRLLVTLLAHVCRLDSHYLVYEYMKNGSLQDVMTQVQAGTRKLDWLARHKIALQVVTGLEYLHIYHIHRIIHRDLKPANILLDDHMEARIADFGLAKLMPDAKTHVRTAHVAGTAGYIAPECYEILKLNDKCDIYSFGVVLGVLVTGKFPSDEFFRQNGISLVKWMRNAMTFENPTQVIDPKLMGNGYEEQMLLVLRIARFCTFDDRRERPNSKEVRCMLSQIKH